MSIRILSIVGARPQFVKAASLSRAIQQQNWIQEDILHTGQHFDKNMSESFFAELEIPKPRFELSIHGGQHGQMTGRMLEAIEEVLLANAYDAVLVYGDTNSTLAGALAAAKLAIPVIHVEAGLRSFNRQMPEEINRVLTDHVSKLLFCPTSEAVKNLQREGIEKGVFQVGDIMYDAVLHVKASSISEANNIQPIMDKYAFLTIHRADATQNIEQYAKLLTYALQFARYNNLQVVYPVHPRTKDLLTEIEIDFEGRFVFLDPISYFATQQYLAHATYVLTDSGGLQKEAYFHRVPCITLRNETEWVETITHGWNRLWTSSDYLPRQEISDYGNGDAANKILQKIKETLS